MLEWLKRHAWKACVPQKGIASSNLALSAKRKAAGCDSSWLFSSYGGRELARGRRVAETDMRAFRPDGCLPLFARTPREGTEMPQAQRRGISLFFFAKV